MPRQSTYKNGFYGRGRPSSDCLPILTASCEPVAHRGFLIFDRGNPHRHSKARDVHLVKDGVCIAMRGSVESCKNVADLIIENPDHCDVQQALSILDRAKTPEPA